MRSRISALLIIVGVLVTSPLTAGDGVWTSSYPYGGYIQDGGLVLDPTDHLTLYAVPNARGVYRSGDGAATWQNLTDGQPWLPFDRYNSPSIHTDGATSSIYLVSSNGWYSLYRSDDGGNSWTDPPIFDGVGESVHAVAFAPSNPAVVYVGTWAGNVFASSDGGGSWGLAASGLPAEPVHGLAADPGNPSIVYLGSETSGIYKSTNGGGSWVSVNNNVTMNQVNDIVVDPTAPLTVYAVDVAGPSVFKSVNGGGSWSLLPVTLQLNAWRVFGRILAIDPSDPQKLVCAHYGGVQRSTDGGANWSFHAVTDDQLTTVVIDSVTATVVYAGTQNRGVWKSLDGGVSWAAASTGIRALSYQWSEHSLAFDASSSSTVYTGTIDSGYRSLDGGATWSRLGLPYGQAQSFATHPGDPGTVYAFQNELWRSTDSGVSWANWNNGAFCCFAEGDIAIHSSDPLTLYLAAHGSGASPDGVYRSTDGGLNWSHVGHAGSGLDQPVRTIAVDPNNGARILAGTMEVGGGNSGIFESVDGGDSWSRLGGLPGDFHTAQILIHPADGNTILVAMLGSNSGVFRSQDGGGSWNQLLQENVTSIASDPGDPNRIYVGTWNSGGFYRTLDGGASWAQINQGLPENPAIQTVAVDPANPDRVLLGAISGTWELSFAGSVLMTVTNPGDSGPGTLRDALTQANQDGVPNHIGFAPWLAGNSIGLASPLPPLSEGGTAIEGDLDGDCIPDIEIAGWGTCCDGITVDSAGNTIRGLVINGFPGNGVIMYGAGATGNVVECSYLGSNFWGNGPAGNGFGVHLVDGASGNRIGGDPATQGNVISANNIFGVHIRNASGNTVEGNRIGVAADGSTPLGNGMSGVEVETNASNNVIGPANVIAHNAMHGIEVVDGDSPGYPAFDAMTTDAVEVFPVLDLGTDNGCGPFRSVDGITPVDGSGAPFVEHFGARFTGTLMVDAAGDYSFDVLELDDAMRLIVDSSVELDHGGGPGSVTLGLGAGPHSLEVDYQNGRGGARLSLVISGPGNASLSTDGNIGGCTGGQSGLCGELFRLRQPSEGNTITQNAIYENGGYGIILGGCDLLPSDPGDLDVGPNTYLNRPLLGVATDLGGGDFQIDGLGPDNSMIEFFAIAPDPSGHGEGAVYLTSAITDLAGNFTATVNLPGGYYTVTATATDAAGNTSDFAANLPLATHYITVSNAGDSGPGSLRDALEQGNNDAAPTVIDFDGSLAGQTIHLLSGLPAITDPETTIDGDLGGDCTPDIALDGSLAGPNNPGLNLFSSDNTVRGLAIHSVGSHGILIAPLAGPPADRNVLECNHIGTDLSGTVALGNAHRGVGVELQANDNHIGPGNIIAHNGLDGVGIISSFIPDFYPGFGGLSPDPVQVFPIMSFSDQNGAFESTDAIIPVDGSGATFTEHFGARFTGTLNVDAAGTYAFALIQPDDQVRVVVDGVPILDVGCCGDASTGWTMGAGPHAIEVDYYEGGGYAHLQLEVNGPGTASLTTDGNTGGCPGGQTGLCGELFREELPSLRNTVTQNAIFDNGDLGIDIGDDFVSPNDPGDLDTGSNETLNFPELTGFTDHGGGSFTVEGTAQPDAVVELFGSDLDPSGHGEGKVFLGAATADPGGAFSHTFGLPAEFFAVTATATDGAGNTSEFSANLMVKTPDAVSVGSVTGLQGDTVSIPIRIRDLAATPLGLDRPAGTRIQGFVFQISWSPAAGVAAASAQRSGIASGLSPLFETTSVNGNSLTYLVSYDEVTDLVPFTLDGPAPGDEVAELVITLDLAAPLAPIQLTLDGGGTLLSNQGGTAEQSQGDGTLALFDGSVTVLPRSASALSAAARSSSEIQLWWSDPQADEIGFRIDRSPDSWSWATVATLGPDDTSHVDGGLPDASLFYYRVVAFSGTGDAAPSNVAAAQTHPATPALACVRPLTFMDHSWARFADASHNGSYWGSVRQERNGGTADEIVFQLLHPDGWPTGNSRNLARNDMYSQLPTVIWNGARFGVFWSEHQRGPLGAPHRSTLVFSLLDAWGQPERERVRLQDSPVHGGLHADLEFSFDWDGGGWGHSAVDLVSDTTSDVFFWRFAEAGDLLTGPVNVSNTPGDVEWSTRLAFSGSEHGISWVREQTGTREVLFQRRQIDGSPVAGDPAPVVLWQNTTGETVQGTDIVWNGAGWVVAWDVIDIAADQEWIALRLLAPDGTPLGPVKRLSDTVDAQMAEQGQDWWPVYDELPKLMKRPGGGYMVFTSSWTRASSNYEIGVLAADANGDRVEHSPGLARRIVSDLDGWTSVYQRVAGNGSDFLATYNDSRHSTLEVASVRVAEDGSVISGPHDLSGGHSPGNDLTTSGATNGHVVPLAGGFATIWTDTTSGYQQIYAQIVEPSGSPGATLAPLSGRDVMGTPALVGVGDTFAVAWKDSGGTVVFTRWDAGGGSLLGEVQVATSTSARAHVRMAFSGEAFGILYRDQAGLQLQTVDPNGSPLGPPTWITDVVRSWPAVEWVGAGWAVMWRGLDNNLHYSLVDPWGGIAVTDTVLTSTGNMGFFTVHWTGELLGLAWQEDRGMDPPGAEVYFSVLNLDGSPAIPEVLVQNGYYWGGGGPHLYWRGDRFHLVRSSGTAIEGSWEDEILPDGTLFSDVRQLANRGSAGAVAFDGATLGQIWRQFSSELYFQTDACLADASPPECPQVNLAMGSNGVDVGWSSVNDPESGIWRYLLYRDGVQLAELFDSTTSYTDTGYRRQVHSYEVRALNGAYAESVGCAVESFSTVAGDANGDGVVSNADIFYLINFFFSGGEAPRGDADANGDGQVTIADIFFLINYLFGGGPEPTVPIPPSSELGADVLTVGSGSGLPGSTVRVPVFLRDITGTPLDELAGPDAGIQGFAFQLSFSAPESIVGGDFELAGLTAGASPVFPVVDYRGDDLIVLVNFREAATALPFTPDASPPGDLVGELVLTIAGAAMPDSTVNLVVTPMNAELINDTATVGERAAAGTLMVVDGAVHVLPVAIFADDFETGDTSHWSATSGG